MFITHNTWKLKVLDFFRESDQNYWSGVELGLRKPWFLMTISFKESSEGSPDIEYLRDVMVANVSDMEAYIREDAKGRNKIISAMIVIPTNDSDDKTMWKIEPLAAIWTANESNDPKNSVDICETQSGAKFVVTFGASSLCDLVDQTLVYKF